MFPAFYGVAVEIYFIADDVNFQQVGWNYAQVTKKTKKGRDSLYPTPVYVRAATLVGKRSVGRPGPQLVVKCPRWTVLKTKKINVRIPGVA